MRCFPGKFTQLAQILHDRRSWRSRQISTLHLCLSSSIINSVIISSTLHLYDECYQISLSFNNDQSFNLSYFIIVLYYNDILIGDYIQGWRLCIHYYHHKRKPWHFDYIISCSVLIETLKKIVYQLSSDMKLNELSHTAWTAIIFKGWYSTVKKMRTWSAVCSMCHICISNCAHFLYSSFLTKKISAHMFVTPSLCKYFSLNKFFFPE